jgi:hypothetical protein
MYTHTGSGPGLLKDSDRVSALLADSWATRVAVRTADLDLSGYYDTSAPDYPMDLVPFRDDPRYQSLDEGVRRRILAGAWVAYNEKTIGVETSIVGPACQLLLRGAFVGPDSGAFKRVIAQTQIDEQFHILMCMDACLVARKMHGIDALVIPTGAVVNELERVLSHANDARHAELIQLAYAVVAEVTINAYLDLLADDLSIQPLNRQTTMLHRKDEYSHRKIFRDLTIEVFAHFDAAEKRMFVDSLTSGLEAFVTVDFNAWRAILEFLQIPAAAEIIDGCLAGGRPARILRDYTGFLRLLTDMGVDASEIKFEF